MNGFRFLLMGLLCLLVYGYSPEVTYGATVYKGNPLTQITLPKVSGIVVVNKANPLPKDYTPDSSTTKEVTKALDKLKVDALSAGYKVEDFSDFRPYSRQDELYKDYVRRDGQAKADTYSMKAGYSEHQTGLAFDMHHYESGVEGCSQPSMADNCKDLLGIKWLHAHAHEYGFIVRYTAGNEAWTGIKPEYWHIRYIGVENAKKYNEQNASSLEQFVGLSKGGVVPVGTASQSTSSTAVPISTANASSNLGQAGLSNASNGGEYSTGTEVVDATASSDKYKFTSVGVLKNLTSSGSNTDGLFDTILKDKQSTVLLEMQNIVDGGFTKTDFKGGLYSSDSKSIWDADLEDWKESETPTIFYMEGGNIAYKIEVPEGVRYDDEGKKRYVNQAAIGYAIDSVGKYKEMMQESVYVGLLHGSYNIYNLVPSKQVPVSSVLEPIKENGSLTGRYKIKESGTGIRINYTLMKFYHPISGGTEAINVGDDQTAVDGFIKNRIKGVDIKASSGKQAEFALNGDFSKFYADLKANSGVYSAIESSNVTTQNGVKKYKASLAGREVLTKSRIDSSFQLAMPKVFVRNEGDYKLSNSDGYTLIDDTYLVLVNANVYKGASDSASRKAMGSFESFAINLDGIAIMPISVGRDGKPAETSENTVPRGVIVPLWFKEVISDTSVETGEAVTEFTGRTIKFSNDYNTKSQLDTANRDLLAIDTKIDGRLGIELRRFSFPKEGNYDNRDDHINTGNAPEYFSVQASFEADPEASYRGFFIYRNNYYLSDDNALIKWLDTDEAKAMTDVDTKRLKALITGEIGLEKPELSYEDWLRMKEIRAEVDKGVKDYLISTLKIVSMIFGVLILIYSIFLSIAYWFDIVNTFFEFKVLKIITGGRLYPIDSKASLEYVTSSDTNVKYVTWVHVLLITMAGMVIGMIFMYTQPIINLIFWLYFKITIFMGV